MILTSSRYCTETEVDSPAAWMFARNQPDHLDLFFGLPWTSFSFKSGAQMAAAESMSFAVGKMVLMIPRLTMSKSGKCNVEYGRVDIDPARLQCHARAKHQ